MDNYCGVLFLKETIDCYIHFFILRTLFLQDEDLPTGFDSDRSDEGNENDWSDWRGNLSGAVCLFCPANYTDFSEILNHMNIVHEFDYGKLKSSLGLNFYQQIKVRPYTKNMVNFYFYFHK